MITGSLSHETGNEVTILEHWVNARIPKGKHTIRVEVLNIPIGGGGDTTPTENDIIRWYQERWGRTASRKEISDWLGTGKSREEVQEGILGHKALIAGYIPRVGEQSFINNPTGFALVVRYARVIQRTDRTSWKTNPMAGSAILIAPPCPKKISGKGVVTDILSLIHI